MEKRSVLRAEQALNGAAGGESFIHDSLDARDAAMSAQNPLQVVNIPWRNNNFSLLSRDPPLSDQGETIIGVYLLILGQSALYFTLLLVSLPQFDIICNFQLCWKYNRHHHKISNGFTGYNGLVLVLMETVMNPVGFYL